MARKDRANEDGFSERSATVSIFELAGCSGPLLVGVATALVQTAQEIAIVQAGGIIPMILSGIVGSDARLHPSTGSG
jgi:hypothetical protein